VKAGYCIFLTSRRNSIAAQESLLKTIGYTKILTPTPRLAAATAMLDALSLSAYEVPTVDDLLAKEYPHFEYTKSYPADADDIIAIIYTSSSTGIPKPII
jgi:acyl-coenzyme A synthetase/AMP-(fatty) acid ligase